jgi:ADP-ribose pyrophosphatase
VFLATELAEVSQDLQGEEEQHLRIERIRLDDVPALIGAGELVDAKTVIGLLLAREVLG